MRLREFVRLAARPAGLVAGLVLLLAVAGPAHAQDGDEGEGADPAEGAELYATNCVVCHGENGEGRVGASLDHVYGGISPDAFFEQTISRGVEGTFMPAFAEAYGGPLTDAQIEHIVAYIESWGTAVEPPVPAPRPPAEEIPPVPEVDGDPNDGYTVYQTNCVVCHGQNGEGRVGATLDPAFAGISADAFVIQTISRGRQGTLMPPFAQQHGGPLAEQEIQDVAAYVLSLEQPARPAQGEVVGQASGWPLLAVLVGTLIVVLALGIGVARRESPPGELHDDHDDH